MLVLLLQLDGKLPNVALMRIAAHHRALGDTVELRRVGNASAIERDFEKPDRVYASLIFEWTRPLAERLLQIYPKAIVGGTGWDLATKLEDHGIATKATDYSIYPRFAPSIGFLQRGCRLSCSFCVVPRKEGPVAEEQTVAQLWRGDGHARDLLILDNDPFGNPAWRERFAEIREGGFRACFSQGINARLMDDEGAAALAGLLRSGQLRDDSFEEPRCYTAWDSRPDEERLFNGLRALVAHGARPRELMVFMLVGFAGKNRPAKPVGPDELPFADAHHSHLDRPESGLFAVAVGLVVREVVSVHVVAEAWGRTVCVAIASRPCAIPLQNLGYCVEVSRVASDGTTEHAASLALGAIRRAALALGYLRLVSYTILGEAGTSYRAAGWHPTALVRDRQRSCPSRPRRNRVLLGDRIRWETGPLAFAPPKVRAEDLKRLIAANLGREIRARSVSDLPLFDGVA